MSKVKISGHQIQKLQKQEQNLIDEIGNDEFEIAAKKKELEVLQKAVSSS